MSDDTPISETDAIFARAYANALKTKFQLDIGEHFCILTSPVTLRGMAAGDLVYPQMTNFLIYKLADALQYSDNPSYTGASAGSYIQQLSSYIDWIKPKGTPSQVVIDRMNKARHAATIANTNYFIVLMQAKKEYDLGIIPPTETFWEWVTANYPPLAAADRTRRAAQIELYQAMQLYFGPDAGVLTKYLDNIANAQLPSISFPGYNQNGLFDDEDLIANAIKYANSGVKPPEHPIAQSTICVPSYVIPSYISSVQSWITAAGQGATRDQVITIDIEQGRTTTWQDYGFKEVNGGGRVGFWPFFSAEVYVNNKWETRTLETECRENDVCLQLRMIGIQKFDVQAGQWDVANIKTLFPTRLPDAPEVLSSAYARIVSFLVGYDVELKVEFSSSMREEVNSIYEEVKKTGGRMSIFGFRVSAGAGGGSKERVETKFSDVKWDNASGSMSLTPIKGQVYPTILAAVARRFD